MKKFLLPLLIFFSSIIIGCNKDDNNSNVINEAILYARYDYPSGGNPSLVPNYNLSDDRIIIGNSPVVDMSDPGKIKLKWSAVRFKKNTDVFALDLSSIKTEHHENDTWTEDDENKLIPNLTKDLDIVLVLDVSSSLGTNIDNIKQNSVQMINSILTNNPNIRIAIIKFSRGSISSNFSSNINYLTNFINTNAVYNSSDQGTYILEDKNATALYESINEAINLLSNSTSTGKGILTFTDGANNYWINQNFQTPDLIINNLNNSDISSYTIGFTGNQNTVNKNVLEDIAVNGDFSFPNNLEELNNVFVRFSNNIATVYDLEYITENPNTLIQPIDYRFKFILNKTN